MKEYISILRQTPLFAGLDDEQVETLTARLGMKKQIYGKGETVYHSGQFIRSIGILVAGRLMIQRDDYWGNRSVVDRLVPGEIFGEAFALQDSEAFFLDVITLEDSIVLSFAPQRLFDAGPDDMTMALIQNLLRSMSAKNRLLAQKIGVMAHRTTRKKLIAYLSARSRRAGSAHFVIPFDRQQLADYLGVDRSAMCSELSKMRRDGLLTFHKSTFDLFDVKEK